MLGLVINKSICYNIAALVKNNKQEARLNGTMQTI